ncbi:hypothetical protein FQN55_006874 [Onygenales sp. PD_40]|nr:hypothetical protein FQN55_006874 [Onygenales sp. PD_40]
MASRVDVIPLFPKKQTPSSLNHTRRVTPSSESSASKRCLIVAPRNLVPDAATIDLAHSQIFQSWKHLFHSGQADVGRPGFSYVPFLLRTDITPTSAERTSLQLHLTHEERERENGKESPDILKCRHIILNFNLRENPRHFFKDEYATLLDKLFPDTLSVSFDGHFLLFCMKSLPVSPRPRTVAGVQAYFTTDPSDEGPFPPLQRRGAPPIKIRKDIDCRKDVDGVDLLFDIIADHFNTAHIPITEMQYWENFVVIVLEHRETDLTDVPSEIARCSCYYLFEDEMDRPPELPAPRLKEPKPTKDIIVDDSKYETLRPGVMLSSEKHPEQDVESLASSGILLKDGSGNNYMTVASHGFPFDGARVFHPVAGEIEVGTVMMKLAHTDISLVRLHLDVHFVNECFENSLGEDTPVRLRRLEKSAHTPMGCPVYMNNPFTGYSEGTYGPWGRLRVPSDDPNEPAQRWIRTRWAYLGQGASQHLVDGVCGSPLWTQQGNVVGFFNYAPQSGHFRDWCLTVVTGHLVDGGYSIA